MAFDISAFLANKSSKTSSGFNVDNFLKSKGFAKQDLTGSQGLYDTALAAGGNVAGEANKIMNPDQSLWGRIKAGSKLLLGKTLDILQRPNYAIATAIKNEVDKDPNTDFTGGLVSGITGKTKNTFSDVFSEAGWNPDTKLGKFGKGAAGFALDVLLDPTTYLTFGYGAGAKVAGEAGVKILSKAGTEFAAKAAAKKLGIDFGEEFIKKSVVNMAEHSPELYGKFIDQGGLKFFGKTLVSSGRIAGTVKMLPGVTKLDEASLPLRNTLYALFNRDASAKFGKLPQEFIDLKQKYLDLGATKSADAVDEAIKIAQANKITQQEAEIITNAIESKTHLADDRLDNARRLFERVLGRNLKDELKSGIAVGELPNYVPHILLENPTKNIPFKPEGARVSLGAAKERTIGQIAQDVPKELQPLVDEAKKFKTADEFVAASSALGKTPEELKAAFELAQPKIGVGKDIEQATIKQINDAFGKDFFDPNIINNVANRSTASARAVTSKDFLRDVASKFGAVAETAPSNYVEAGAKELKGFKFHPAIAEQIDTFKKALIGDDATNNLLRSFDKVQNLWKASVTSLFPAFHGRNALSNVFLNFLDIGAQSLNPTQHYIAGELLNLDRQASKLEKVALSTGEKAVTAKKDLAALLDRNVIKEASGKQWTFKELRKAVKESRVAFSSDYTGFLDVRETVKEKLGEAATVKSKAKNVLKAVNPLSQENLAFKAGRKTAQTIEEQARLVNFITNLQKTGDVAVSAARTKQFLFDYQNLSAFEKTFMRRIVPFYTFTRKNLELQAKQLIKQPGKFAGQAKLFNTVSDILSGGTLTEDEKKQLPDWLQQGLGIVTKRNGNDVEIINQLGTPIEAMFGSIQPNAILGSLSPVAAVPLQVAIGKHFFFDRDLKDVNDATAFQKAPQFVKDYIGFTTRKNKDGTDRYIALNPTRMFILQNIPPSSRVVSVIGQLEDNNVSGKLKLMRQLTGLKPYGKNLDTEATYREKEKIKALQDLLDKAGVAPIFQRSFVPKAASPYLPAKYQNIK